LNSRTCAIAAKRIGLLAGAVLFAAPMWAGATVAIQGVRVHQSPDYTRVVFDTSAPVRYRVFTLEDPPRVVLDLDDTAPRDGLQLGQISVDSTSVRSLRSAVRGGKNFRIVLDVDRVVRPNAFTLQPIASYGHRLVVDLYSQAATPQQRVGVSEGRLRSLVVAIDAGHGGEDPGAVGVGKVYEKQVVLKVAQHLDALFDAEPGYRGELVRSGDYYVSLRRRTQIAREKRADLFVSIHADAFNSRQVRGASVYTLSKRGASSETARWLAEKENRSDLIGGVGAVSLDDKDDLLAHVLLDLSMDANQSASIEAGEAVLGALGGITRLHKSTLEQAGAGFVVLKSPDIPSILIETGYLSNPAEARELKRADYQKRLARAIFTGLTSTLEAAPPPDTLLAARQSTQGKNVKHVIRRGDTLSEIASRYRISAGRLREANGIAGDAIRVGQVLIIPAS
jgi:N-acetylmuramoyl-L-alanine amidase